MTKFSGRGLLESYSCEIVLMKPVSVHTLGALLGLPEDYDANLIAVRGSKKLSANDLIYDMDEIILFLAVMGG